MNVPVGVALLVNVTVGVRVRDGVKVAAAVEIEVGVVDTEVGVAVAVEDGPAVGDTAVVAVGVGLADGETVGDASAVGVAGPGVCVEDGVCVGGSVLVIGAVGGSLKQPAPKDAIETRRQTSPQDERSSDARLSADSRDCRMTMRADSTSRGSHTPRRNLRGRNRRRSSDHGPSGFGSTAATIGEPAQRPLRVRTPGLNDV